MTTTPKIKKLFFWLLIFICLSLCCVYTAYITWQGTNPTRNSSLINPNHSLVETTQPNQPVTTITASSAEFNNQETVVEVPTNGIVNPTIDMQTLFLKSESFSLENSNPVPPENILEEVSYYPSGGTAVCPVDRPQSPIFLYPQNDIIEVNWLDVISFFSCGWQVNEKVLLTITSPDSSVNSITIYASPFDVTANYGMVTYEILPSSKIQTGNYQFVFEGESGRFEKTVEVIYSTTPHVYLVNHEDGEYLVLYSFKPNENIQILSYSSKPGYKLAFSGWRVYQVNSNGQLLIKIESPNQLFFVIGETSGFYKTTYPYRIPRHQDIIKP